MHKYLMLCLSDTRAVYELAPLRYRFPPLVASFRRILSAARCSSVLTGPLAKVEIS